MCRLVSFVKPVIVGKQKKIEETKREREKKVSECGTTARLEEKDGLIYLGFEREFLFLVEDLDSLGELSKGMAQMIRYHSTTS